MDDQATTDATDLLLVRKALDTAIQEHRNFIAFEGGGIAEDFKINAELATNPNNGVLLRVNVPDSPASLKGRTDIFRFFTELSDSFRRVGFRLVHTEIYEREKTIPHIGSHTWRAESVSDCQQKLCALSVIMALKGLTRLAVLHPKGFEAGVESLGMGSYDGVVFDNRKAIRAELAAYRTRQALYPRG